MDFFLLPLLAVLGLAVAIMGCVLIFATLAGIAWIPELGEKLWDRIRGR
jgi:hypothetical protein